VTTVKFFFHITVCTDICAAGSIVAGFELKMWAFKNHDR